MGKFGSLGNAPYFVNRSPHYTPALVSGRPGRLMPAQAMQTRPEAGLAAHIPARPGLIRLDQAAYGPAWPVGSSASIGSESRRM